MATPSRSRSRHGAAATPQGKAKGQSPIALASARGVWSGSISFGLLQIAVTLHPAQVRTEQVHLHMLDRRDLSRVQLQRINAKTKRPVEWKDVVRGYAIGDELVVLDKEDLAKANVRATKTIAIQDFVPAASLEPMYFDTPYYLVPRDASTKAYVLLRDALAKKGAVAIASFVLRTREHLVALMAVGDALVLEVLRFAHELRAPSEMGLPHLPSTKALGARELEMGEKLVEAMMTEWDPGRYKDSYHEDVRTLVREKLKRGETTAHHEPERAPTAADADNLLELLQKSLHPRARGAEARSALPAKRIRAARVRPRMARKAPRSAA